MRLGDNVMQIKPRSIREEIAALCHRQWAGWMDYMFSKAEVNQDGSWTMPKEFVARWKRQAETDYADLSESEQNSDRNEADKFIDIFLSFDFEK